jgi:putative colanic acid biosynthesis UDP-glucose lipid carrier transferase
MPPQQVTRQNTRFLNREHTGMVEFANRGLDIAGCLMAAALVTVLVPIAAGSHRDWLLLVLINVFINMLAFQQAELYRSWRGRPYSDQFSRLLMAWALASAITWIIWRYMELHNVIGPQWFAGWLGGSLLLIGSQRAAFHLTIRFFRSRGVNNKRVVVYGAGGLGRSIAGQVARSPESGFQIVAFLDDDPALKGQSIGPSPILGGMAMLSDTLAEQQPDELWVALPLSATQKVADILEVAETHMVSVRMFPDLIGLTLLNHSVNEMLGFPIIDLNVDRMQGMNHVIKTLEDKVLGVIFFIIALPVIGLIAIAVKMTSEGPVLFKQRRNGWDGKPFTIYKFRTMHVHQEPEGQLTQARQNDDRFTPVGRWLRRTSLDELPQLYNVLQGRMSLVGPRPHAIEHDHLYRQKIEGYMRRNRVKPGITGWAQINDLRGEVQNIEEMVRRVKHDLYYIEHWSLWFDLRIILATILKIFFSKRAW